MSTDPQTSGSHEVAEAIHRLRRLIHAGFVVFPVAVAVMLDPYHSNGSFSLLIATGLFLIAAVAPFITATLNRWAREEAEGQQGK